MLIFTRPCATGSSLHGCNICGKEGHQAALCANGTVDWATKWDKAAFVADKPHNFVEPDYEAVAQKVCVIQLVSPCFLRSPLRRSPCRVGWSLHGVCIPGTERLCLRLLGLSLQSLRCRTRRRSGPSRGRREKPTLRTCAHRALCSDHRPALLELPRQCRAVHCLSF